GNVLRLTASVGPLAAAVWHSDIVEAGRLPLSRGSVAGRAFIDRYAVHVHDVSAASDDEFPVGKALQRAYGGRGTTLAVPLLRESVSLGVITLVRDEVNPFTERQIALLQTFAHQAVIAIENVGLFKEREAGNRDLRATSEILRVIASSPPDTQPVLDTVAESAARLCEAFDTVIFRRDGDRLLLVAHHGPIPIGTIGAFTLPLTRGSGPGRSVLDGRACHIADLQAETAEFPEGSELAQRLGFRTVLAVPLMREGAAIGTIALRRDVVQLFTERQVALLRTFADQAVIAIENVRLFKELEEKNRALTAAHAQVTETLEQQTATTEILRVISSSPTDLRPVFDTIVRNAVQLCGATYGSAYRIDGDVIYLVAETNMSGAGWERFRMTFPRPLRDGGVIRDVVKSRRLLYVENVDAYPFSAAARALFVTNSTRSLLTVPMIRQD